MYKLENGTNATERQLEQLVDLHYCRIWFFEFIALNNTKKVSVEEYLREYFIRPLLPFTTMLLDNRDNVAGLFSAMRMQENAPCELHTHSREYEDRATMRQFFDAYDAIGLANDYCLDVFNVRSDLQGVAYAEFDHRVVADILAEECIRQAKEKNCTRITSFFKKTNHKSPEFDLFINKYNAEIILEYDMLNTVFNDTIICAALNLKN